MRRLLYKNYLSMIEALPNNELFRHIYVKNENGEEIDVTNNGQLSCAVVVSSVLCLIGWIDRPHATVNSTLNKLLENAWTETNSPIKGDIILYGEGKTGNRHLGFYIDNATAISNSSQKGVPIKHDLTMADGRAPEKYFTRDYSLEV